ncbi:MAG: ATP-dependent Clp protease ATP-binding subunit [Ktedonobacteraceae bacterium]|nr:ATP-dependent Clp protease ATP-binding subunit [Ktedonobacteraceae bacterium]
MSRQEKYTNEVRQTLAFAREEARRLRFRLVNTEHLLLGLLKLKDPLIEDIFVSLHTSNERISQAMDFVVGRSNKAILSEPALHPATRTVLGYAAEEAAAVPTELIRIEHLLLAILREQDGIATGVLGSFAVTLESVREVLASLKSGGTDDLNASLKHRIRYDATPVLNSVSRDLTKAALDGEIDPMIGREAELERTMQILSRRSKNNPVLIGPAGVGKTAIAEGLAVRIIEGRVPENLLSYRVVALDVASLTAGTKFRGDFEERLKMIMQEVVGRPGLIIFIDEIHTLLTNGGAEGSIDTANLFKPMLARGEFQCIGATTLDEYRRIIEGDAALERRFQPVQVAETDFEETLAILRGLRSRYADFHRVSISDEALVAAVQLSSRYIQHRFQPDKAIDALDEAAARVHVQNSAIPDAILQRRDEIVIIQREKEHAIAYRDFPNAARLLRRERQLQQELWQAEQDRNNALKRDAIVDEQDIADVVALQTGIPVQRVASPEAMHLLNLEQELHQRIIGQDEAVQAVAKAVRRSRVNIRDSHRPIGSFLFVGPTGVGKTALAHTLAASLFGDENALLKLDMSEFMESHSTARLTGSPAGYIGHDQAGQLTEAVRRRPYSIVLFDEIEKAHPKVFDLLLQILEEGRLTDARGQVVDFRHTIIILTSNEGTSSMPSEAMGFAFGQKNEEAFRHSTHENIRAHVMSAVQELFRPELFNRIDDIVFFHPLDIRHLHEIANLMIVQLQQRLSALSITSQVTDEARSFLVKAGYNPADGARPLRRTIQSLLEDMLAEALLRGTLIPGDSIIVDLHDNELYISSQEATVAAVTAVSKHNQEAA